MNGDKLVELLEEKISSRGIKTMAVGQDGNKVSLTAHDVITKEVSWSVLVDYQNAEILFYGEDIRIGMDMEAEDLHLDVFTLVSRANNELFTRRENKHSCSVFKAGGISGMFAQ